MNMEYVSKELEAFSALLDTFENLLNTMGSQECSTEGTGHETQFRSNDVAVE